MMISPRRIRGLCLAALFIAAVLPAAADDVINAPSLVLADAHGATVTQIAFDAPSGLLFSGSSDGSVLVSADGGARLVQRLHVGINPVVKLAAGPGDQLSVIERLAGNRFRLGVWNYRTGKQRFVSEFAEPPLFMAFSPRGNYLVVSLSRWNSLLFLDLTQGTWSPWLSTGFGLVDFAVMSTREDRVMSYQATTGAIVYHDLASGAELKSLPTKARLTAFQMIPDATKTKAIALDGQAVCVVDLVAGGVIDSKPLQLPPLSLLVDPTDPSRVVVVCGTPQDARIFGFAVDTTGILTLETVPPQAKLDGTAWCLAAGSLLVGDSAGKLLKVGLQGERHVLLERRSVPITSAAVTPAGLYLSTATGLFRIPADFASQVDAVSLAKFEAVPIAGIAGGARLAIINDRELAFWESGKSPRLGRLDLRKDVVSRSAALPAPLRSLQVRDDRLVTVDTKGNIRLWGPDLKPAASFSSLRAVSGTILGDDRLVVGQSASASGETTLQSIVIRTGETLGLPAQGSVRYAVAAERPSGAIHGIVLAAGTEREPLTVWERLLPDADGKYTGPALTVLRLTGEDSEAHLVLSEDGSTAYTSLGGGAISALEPSGLRAFGTPAQAPRQLALWRDWIVSVNASGSASLYTASSGRLAAELVAMADGRFLLVRSDGSWALSPKPGTKTVESAETTAKSNLAMWISPSLSAFTADGTAHPAGELSGPFSIP